MSKQAKHPRPAAASSKASPTMPKRLASLAARCLPLVAGPRRQPPHSPVGAAGVSGAYFR